MAIKLKYDFPEKNFRVYLHDNTILRFHQVHKGETPWFSDDVWQEKFLN